MKPLNLFFIVFTSCFALYANETNKVFITDDGFLSIHRTQLLKEAEKAKESLPASEFLEGNWGLIKDGFQLSLRFNKLDFTNGEPITAILLLRNVTNHVITYLYSSEAGKTGPIRFAVSSATGETISTSLPDTTTIISAFHRGLVPDTQQKFLERLDKEFSLTNGTYYVQARLKTSCPKCVVVESAKVPIKLKMENGF